MLNRYQGNTGRVERIDDAPPMPAAPIHTPEAPRAAQNTPADAPHGAASAPPIYSALGKKAAKLLPAALGELRALESEDIILLLILYLMYRESGDTELLIIMCAMLLL